MRQEASGDLIVRVDNVHKSYGSGAGRVDALTAVSLQVEAGEFLALSGPSGSGKSTLLNLIGALDVPTSGTILLEGKAIGGLSRTALARIRRDRLGFVFQAYNLIPIMTAVENTEFTLALQRRPKQQRRALAMEALAQVGLAHLADRLPGELSGGQQQRVAIARAIAPGPAVILADEPTANLDSVSTAVLLDLMQDLNNRQKVTFIFSTHDTRVLERAKRIVDMVDGRCSAHQ